MVEGSNRNITLSFWTKPSAISLFFLILLSHTNARLFRGPIIAGGGPPRGILQGGPDSDKLGGHGPHSGPVFGGNPPPPIAGNAPRPRNKLRNRGEAIQEVIGPNGDKRTKIRLGPIVFNPESLDYDDDDDYVIGREAPERPDRVIPQGGGLDIFNKIFVSLKNFLVFIPKLFSNLSSQLEKQIKLLTTGSSGTGIQKEGQMSLLVIVVVSWLIFGLIVALVAWNVHRADPVQEQEVEDDLDDGNQQAGLEAEESPVKSHSYRALWKLPMQGTISPRDSAVLLRRLKDNCDTFSFSTSPGSCCICCLLKVGRLQDIYCHSRVTASIDKAIKAKEVRATFDCLSWTNKEPISIFSGR